MTDTFEHVIDDAVCDLWRKGIEVEEARCNIDIFKVICRAQGSAIQYVDWTTKNETKSGIRIRTALSALPLFPSRGPEVKDSIVFYSKGVKLASIPTA